VHSACINHTDHISVLWPLFYVCLFLCLRCDIPPVGQVFLIHEVSRSHSKTHHCRCDSSGRVISSSQRSLPDNTQHSQQTSMPPVGFEPTISAGERPQTHTLDRAAGHWDWHCCFIHSQILTFSYCTSHFNVLALCILFYLNPPQEVMQWRSLVRHCAASRKVAGSVPDGVVRIFHWLNPSRPTMSFINENQEYLVGGKFGRCVGLSALPPSCADCLEILEASNSWVCHGLYADCFICVCLMWWFVFTCDVCRSSVYLSNIY